MSTKAELSINITTNQRLSPTFRGNENTIIVGDSQTSPLPIFPEGGGTSVHRLTKIKPGRFHLLALIQQAQRHAWFYTFRRYCQTKSFIYP